MPTEHGMSERRTCQLANQPAVREAKELLIKCGEHKVAETLRLREETAKCGPAAYYCCAEGN
jgi:hypothetical protein